MEEEAQRREEKVAGREQKWTGTAELRPEPQSGKAPLEPLQRELQALSLGALRGKTQCSDPGIRLPAGAKGQQ